MWQELKDRLLIEIEDVNRYLKETKNPEYSCIKCLHKLLDSVLILEELMTKNSSVSRMTTETETPVKERKSMWE